MVAGKRLIIPLTDDAKVDQLHTCGGNAFCYDLTVYDLTVIEGGVCVSDRILYLPKHSKLTRRRP